MVITTSACVIVMSHLSASCQLVKANLKQKQVNN